ncbi:M56 family metallopeptidase [Chitinophaga sp. G-6-1-13]|uniref:M56 family metallopeptidase n=1 Tax=Chitinophaga fulva TaxID=2728842 RepID=A0A848GWL2_9BACT|nr:M56 family metallopeptidase [Chitinophaga fulva]NML41602.1 M56 family metallopeptidase [Chitinophaga fulva]
MVPAILIYLLKANVALTLFFLAYWLGLRRLTFYTLNRVFLLSGIVCSSLFPLVSVNTFVERHETIAGGIAYLPDLSALTAPAEQFSVWTLLVYLFWTGVAVMTIRLAVQLFSLWKIHRRSSPATVDGVPVRAVKQQVNPFSFFRHIYINPALHQPEERQGILCHEKVHVQQWHSADVVLGELNNIFYWFNPGAWLMKTAIRENLEFITDRYLLIQGVDKKAYQYSLIKVSGIPYATAIANNFNFSHLKNRIIMMNRKQSSTIQLGRYVALGVLVGGMVLSLNYSRASASPQQEPKPATGQPAAAAAPQHVALMKTDSGIAVTIAPDAMSDKPTATPAAKNTAPKANNNPAPAPQPNAAPAPVPAPQAGSVFTLRNGTGPEPIYLLNDRLITRAEMGNIIPNDIESVSVFKGNGISEEMIAEYGEDARNGIIAIYTKSWLAASNKKRLGPTTTQVATVGKTGTVTAGQGQVVGVRNTTTGAVFVATSGYTSGSGTTSSSVSASSTNAGNSTAQSGTVVLVGKIAGQPVNTGTAEKAGAVGKNEEIIVIGKGTAEKKSTTHEE